MGDAIVENNLSNENEKSNTIAMCKKLLATKIVANSFFGLFNKFSTMLDLVAFFCDKSFKSLGDNENKATSEAATKAQQISNIIMPIKPKIKSVFRVVNKSKLGSGSKI